MRWVLLTSAFAVAGCETTRGFGRDMEVAGQAIQREAAGAQAPRPRPTVTPDANIYVAPPPGS